MDRIAAYTIVQNNSPSKRSFVYETSRAWNNGQAWSIQFINQDDVSVIITYMVDANTVKVNSSEKDYTTETSSVIHGVVLIKLIRSGSTHIKEL